MKIKIESFKDVIKKATLNYTIPSIQLNFKDKKVVSNMISKSMDAVIMLNLDNNIIDLPSSDNISLNFGEPNVNVKPYLDLIDEDTADVKISDDNIKISTDKKQKICFHFASPDFVSSYKGDKPKIDTWFFDKQIDDEIMGKFTKIKKIAGKFGKVYFSIFDTKLYIEATDRQNKYSNSMKFELGTVDYSDFNLCFDFNNINALLSLINIEYRDFEVKLHVTEDKKGGMLLFRKEDDSESYYFVSKTES